MELVKIIYELINKADPNLIIFALTSLCAFIAWLIKKLFEKPLDESKKHFMKF